MTEQAIASRYANALFKIDAAKGILEKRVEDFDLLLEFLHRQPRLAHLFSAPHLTVKEKKEVLISLMDGRLDPVLLNFLSFLIEKGRWTYLSQIAKHYRLRVDKHLGIWEADLVTAVPLDPKAEQELKGKLQKRFSKQIKFKKAVDPSLIGGAKLILENEMIDWSLSGKLNRMKKELQK